MKPKTPQSPTNQRDRWLLSYVDVLSILLIFFMVAAARSLPIPTPQKVVAPQPPTEQAEAVPPAEPALAEQAVTPPAAESPADYKEAEPPAEVPEAEQHR